MSQLIQPIMLKDFLKKLLESQSSNKTPCCIYYITEASLGKKLFLLHLQFKLQRKLPIKIRRHREKILACGRLAEVAIEEVMAEKEIKKHWIYCLTLKKFDDSST